jgi:hypothetical protein
MRLISKDICKAYTKAMQRVNDLLQNQPLLITSDSSINRLSDAAKLSCQIRILSAQPSAEVKFKQRKNFHLHMEYKFLRKMWRATRHEERFPTNYSKGRPYRHKLSWIFDTRLHTFLLSMMGPAYCKEQIEEGKFVITWPERLPNPMYKLAVEMALSIQTMLSLQYGITDVDQVDYWKDVARLADYGYVQGRKSKACISTFTSTVIEAQRFRADWPEEVFSIPSDMLSYE